MTTREDIEELITKALRRGAVVYSKLDAEGQYISLRVAKLAGVGTHSMSPIQFAERMRTIPAWWQILG